MPKEKKVNKNDKTQDISAITEVDKAFYETNIEDLNRRIERFTTLNNELQSKNKDLEIRYKTLDEEREDVINSMKRVTHDKVEENKELNKQILELEQSSVESVINYKCIIKEMKEKYILLREQLTSEIKVGSGKLYSMAEFRHQKEELTQKCIAQEQILDVQEIMHKREIYEAKRKFLISQDKLKNDVEGCLVHLSSTFQSATQQANAVSTNRVVRENIVINNDLNTMVNTHQRLYDENDMLKESSKLFKLEAELYKKEMKNAVYKSSTHTKLITKLSNECGDMNVELNNCKHMEVEYIQLNNEMDKLFEESKNLKYRIHLLEQILHASRCERASLKTELCYCKDQLGHLTSIVNECVLSIKTELIQKPSHKGRCEKAPNREYLINNLLALIGRAKDEKSLNSSSESVESVLYTQGAYEFVPKSVVFRSKFPIRRNKEIQIGPSFETLADYDLPISDPEATEETEVTVKNAPVGEFFILDGEVQSVSSEPETEVFEKSSELETITSTPCTSTSTADYEPPELSLSEASEIFMPENEDMVKSETEPDDNIQGESEINASSECGSEESVIDWEDNSEQ